MVFILAKSPSLTSQLTPSFSMARSATSLSTWTWVPHPISVTSEPSNMMSALPSGSM